MTDAMPSAPDAPARPAALVRRPITTYRLQLSAAFDLRAAAQVIAYLDRLGATDCYTSPYLIATPESASGYDVCDYGGVQPELGGEAAFQAFAEALERHRLGHMLDFVPNHMGADARRNNWWRDVLQYGRASEYGGYFDIDWAPVKPELRDRLLLPILGKPYGEALDDGDIRLARAGDALVVTYFDHVLPLNPSTIGDLQPENATTDTLHDLLERQAYRLAYWRTSADEINYRRFFDVDGLVGVRMERQDVFDDAHRFALACVRRGIATSIRVDHPDGLARPVEYLDRLVRECAEAAGGLGIHVVVEKILTGDETLLPRWPVHGTTGYDFLARVNGLFVVPAGGVALARLYARVAGVSTTFEEEAYTSKKLIMETTLASEVHMLARALNRISERHRRSRDFTLNNLRQALVEFVACLAVYRTYLGSSPGADGDAAEDHAGEVAHVRRAVRRARRRNEHLEASVFTFLEAVLLGDTSETSAYPPAHAGDALDRRRFTDRLQQFTGSVVAKGVEDTAFYRHHALLSANEVGGTPAHPSRPASDLHAWNQQRAEHSPFGLLATATHDTKLGEDARARLNVLTELPAEWARQVRRWQALTKAFRTRGDGDATEAADLPDDDDQYRLFQTVVGTWPADALMREPGAVSWSAYVERVKAYMRKAAREAKRHTSWINQNSGYEDALMAFTDHALTSAKGRRFRESARPFIRRVARAGVVNALSQVVLKLGSPGVTDIYQGAELWDLNVVDPDNRRPVDFHTRAAWLEALEPLLARVSAPTEADDRAAVRDLLDDWPSGRIKLFVTAAGLRWRRAHADLVLAARYDALAVDAVGPAEVVAFARRRGEAGAIVAVPRVIESLMTPGSEGAPERWPTGDVWGSTRVRLAPDLEGVSLRNIFTGERLVPETFGGVVGVAASRLLSDVPVAICTWGVE